VARCPSIDCGLACGNIFCMIDTCSGSPVLGRTARVLSRRRQRGGSADPLLATETKSEAAAAGLAFLEFPVESQFGSGFFPIATSSG